MSAPVASIEDIRKAFQELTGPNPDPETGKLQKIIAEGLKANRTDFSALDETGKKPVQVMEAEYDAAVRRGYLKNARSDFSGMEAEVNQGISHGGWATKNMIEYHLELSQPAPTGLKAVNIFKRKNLDYSQLDPAWDTGTGKSSAEMKQILEDHTKHLDIAEFWHDYAAMQTTKSPTQARACNDLLKDLSSRNVNPFTSKAPDPIAAIRMEKEVCAVINQLSLGNQAANGSWAGVLSGAPRLGREAGK